MSSNTGIARSYFEALGAHDLDTAMGLWKQGGSGRFVNQQDLTAPDGVRAYFADAFEAFPDFSLEIIDITGVGDHALVRWRARGTFAGPGMFEGLAPNGEKIELEGCDVMLFQEGRIAHNDAYVDSGSLARQLGVLPPAGSKAEARLTRLANLRTKLMSRIHGDEPERIADGVWLVRGWFPVRTMNVYLIEDDGGVTMFDAGIEEMAGAVRKAGVRLGGIKRIVLGHADPDHRGSAPAIDAPTYCHPEELATAEAQDPNRPYWDPSKLQPHARFVLGRLLPVWDGGAVKIAGTVQEGDEVAGFKVIELPGHAPGQIGLFRESDRLALVSDCFYTVDIQTSIKGAPRVPHPAFNFDTEQARASIRKLAGLQPSVAWPGHTNPATGDVVGQLERAASAPVK
jgi:glyoxylase-like metal-dependent hydrolase (beta-lactamase superfamily II)/predicted ester cyclase